MSQYGWYNSLMSLADGKFLNIDSVLLKTVEESFMFLTYKKDEAAQTRANMKKKKR